MTAQQMSQVIMQTPYDDILRAGTLIKEGSLYIPNKIEMTNIWLRESLTLQNPSKATDAHKNMVAYAPEKFRVEEFLEQIGKDNYLVLNEIYASSVPTYRFGDDPRMIWLYKDQAKEYGLFLQYIGIKKVEILSDNSNNPKLPSANQLRISWSGHSHNTSSGKWEGSQYISSDTSLYYTKHIIGVL
jgi:hypothetical protein